MLFIWLKFLHIEHSQTTIMQTIYQIITYACCCLFLKSDISYLCTWYIYFILWKCLNNFYHSYFNILYIFNKCYFINLYRVIGIGGGGIGGGGYSSGGGGYGGGGGWKSGGGGGGWW